MNNETLRTEEDRDDNLASKAQMSSRLGKEAKIGVSVIAVLLVILGVALTMRLKGSNADDQVAVADEPEQSLRHEDAPSTTEAMLKDTASKHFSHPSAPIIVPAAAASGKPPKSLDISVDQWKRTSERAEAKHANSVPTTPPPFMPTPPAPPKSDRYERYTSDQPKHKDKAEVKVLADQETDAKPLVADDSPPATKKKSAARPADTSGYASLEPPTTLPRYRDRAALDNPVPPSPTAPIVSGSTYSAPSYSSGMDAPAMATATQYDASEYRMNPPTMRHDNSERRRPAAVRSYMAAPQRSDGKYEVQPNDSYWTVSERLYGTGAYFKALAQHNRGKGNDDQLRPGELILAPTVTQLEQSYPDLCPKAEHREAMQTQARTTTVSSHNQLRGGRTYTVVEGDTLFNIARYELGKASRWAELYDLNRDVLGKDFNYLTPGTQLTMPDGERAASIARPQSRGYTR